MRSLIISGLLIVSAFPVVAQTGPDIYAKIRLAGFESPIELRRSGNRTRIDLNTGGAPQTYIADQDRGILISLTATGNKRVAMVFPLDRAPALLPLPIDLSALEARGANLRPIGSSLLAGQSCRLIEFSGYLNQAGVVCVNAQGIIMQMTQKGRSAALYQVASFTAGAQDAKWFVIPPDYQTVALPGIGGAARSPGGVIETDPKIDSQKPAEKSPFRPKK